MCLLILISQGQTKGQGHNVFKGKCIMFDYSISVMP